MKRDQRFAQYRRIRGISRIIGLLCLSAAALAAGSEEIPLAQTWRVQPAQNSRTAPEDSAWGTDPGLNAQDLRANREPRLSAAWWRGTRFAALKAEEVHSLWYEQTIEVPAAWAGSRMWLDFRRIEGDALLFLNGSKLGELLRPGGEIEITPAVRPGQPNVLRVFLTRDYTDISRGFREDVLRYAVRNNPRRPIPQTQWNLGITAPVTLIRRPAEAAVADVFVQTSWRNRELRLQLELEAKSAIRCEAQARIRDREGKVALEIPPQTLALTGGRQSQTLRADWNHPVLWEPDGGYVYTAEVELLVAGKIVDRAKPVAFGFREVWTEGRRMILNGRELRLRMSYVLVDQSGPGHLDLLRMVGFNAGYYQPHSGKWWGNWNESPLYDAEFLAEADRTGFVMFLPSPSVNLIDEALVRDPAVAPALERETALLLRRYRNHPSVLGWIVSMNGHLGRELYATTQAPQTLGKRFTPEEVKTAPQAVRTYEAGTRACALNRRLDPTRLNFAHAAGGIGDIASTNLYLNFAPLQEREEWMKQWAKTGEMPFMASEMGQPYEGNFWKGTRFLLTEYAAIYFGPQAYAAETPAGLAHTLRNSFAYASPDNHGGFRGEGESPYPDWSAEYPLYWDFQRLFVRHTNRAFRTAGFNGGWSYWLIDTHLGVPPGGKARQPLAVARYYNSLPRLHARPAWVNENFDIHRQANQPLLAYLAGAPEFTDKTHAYYAGETVRKALALVWDGPGATTVAADWTLAGADGASLATGSFAPCALAAGDTRFLPLEFAAPAVTQRAACTLTVRPRVNGAALEEDRMALEFWPAVAAPAFQARWALYDPAGKSGAWLRSAGLRARDWRPGDSLEQTDVLVLGRESLRPGADLPYPPAELRRGLRVLILEQKPEVWQGLGFRTTESMPRQLFAADTASPVLAGLQTADFAYWRGSPDLLPEGVTQPAAALHAQKWTNTHALCSTTPQIPRVAGFLPLLAGEFDLDYSPLLLRRAGEGLVAYCALDFTGRVPDDPAATRLAANLLRFLDAPALPALRTPYFSANEEEVRLLRQLGVSGDLCAPGALPAQPERALLILGRTHGWSADQVRAFCAQGGEVFALPQTPQWLQSLGVATRQGAVQQDTPGAASALFPCIGPNLLRWRDTLTADLLAPENSKEMTATAQGTFGRLSLGKGGVTLCQLHPQMLAGRYADNPDRAQAIDLSVLRLQQLLARLLTACGAGTSAPVADRLQTIATAPVYRPIPYWNICGPFETPDNDCRKMQETRFPAEESAVASGFDPNFSVRTPDGRTLNWSKAAKADERGYVNLGALLGRKTQAVAYAVATVESAAARDAVIRVGCDWSMTLWVNGKEVFRTFDGKNRPDSYRVNVQLRQGRNLLCLKAGSGSAGFSFYADLSGSDEQRRCPYNEDLRAGAVLYGGALASDEFDPYLFRFW